MKTGVLFENLLQRGLLELALALPDRSPEFRYSYHETIEEGQHSLMFQEFVNRSGVRLAPHPRWLRVVAALVPHLASVLPELFCIVVLGGEDPIDHAQRVYLSGGRAHPLLERIMKIHVTEEARHLSFARAFLRIRVPKLGPSRLRILQWGAPLVVAFMARLMLRPSRDMTSEFGIPAQVIAGAHTHNARNRAATLQGLEKARALFRELGILTPRTARLWRRLRLLPDGE